MNYDANIKACQDFIKACEKNLADYQAMTPVDTRAVDAAQGMICDFNAKIAEYKCRRDFAAKIDDVKG